MKMFKLRKINNNNNIRLERIRIRNDCVLWYIKIITYVYMISYLNI